jgi:hypothetical protein
VTIREGWIDIKLADDRRLFGNLNTPREPPAPEPEQPDILDTIFESLFNSANIQDLPHEYIEALQEKRSSVFTRTTPDDVKVRIHIGDKGIGSVSKVEMAIFTPPAQRHSG